jgi:radical SAM protein with 4Fe4S-binding SPASM domain
MRVSLRITLTKHNAGDLPALVDLAEDLGVQRFCMYHLAYAGRGAKLLSFDLEADERRQAVEFIFKRTQESFRNGSDLEVLTVDNHTDAAYLLKWGQENAPDLMENMHRLLRRNGGNSAGSGIACIDNLGNVHPDQFWWNRTLGNIKDRPFSEIWSDPENEFLAQLRDRKPLLPQRCKECKFLDVCNGNLRVRAESATGDAWGMDPACYLSPEETARGLA